MAGTAGRSGRRPKPTARKALAGNPGKRALNKDEPVLRPSKVLSHRSGSLKISLSPRSWQLTTKELCGQGLLCVTDLAVLERWCVAYEFWRRAVKILPDRATPSPVQWAAWSKSGADRQKTGVRDEQHGAMLGLDPSSRQRLIGGGQKKPLTRF
ncbi:hypothetical protein BANRA_00033 [Escherichia coli]|nr:P27 family phage terminase small subunit [Escherichia coli]VCW99482.1 hypothetical protein BANRA_00033 [Escherichia coli]